MNNTHGIQCVHNGNGLAGQLKDCFEHAIFCSKTDDVQCAHMYQPLTYLFHWVFGGINDIIFRIRWTYITFRGECGMDRLQIFYRFVVYRKRKPKYFDCNDKQNIVAWYLIFVFGCLLWFSMHNPRQKLISHSSPCDESVRVFRISFFCNHLASYIHMHTHNHMQRLHAHAPNLRIHSLGCYVYLSIQYSDKMRQKIHKIARNCHTTWRYRRKQTCRV